MNNDQLRQIYQELGQTQASMAALMGMSTVTFKRYSTGERAIPEYMARFALLLKVASDAKFLQKYQALVKAEPTAGSE